MFSNILNRTKNLNLYSFEKIKYKRTDDGSTTTNDNDFLSIKNNPQYVSILEEKLNLENEKKDLYFNMQKGEIDKYDYDIKNINIQKKLDKTKDVYECINKTFLKNFKRILVDNIYSHNRSNLILSKNKKKLNEEFIFFHKKGFIKQIYFNNDNYGGIHGLREFQIVQNQAAYISYLMIENNYVNDFLIDFKNIFFDLVSNLESNNKNLENNLYRKLYIHINNMNKNTESIFHKLNSKNINLEENYKQIIIENNKIKKNLNEIKNIENNEFIQLLKNTEDNNRKKIIKLEENNKQIIIENNKIKENLNEVKKIYNNKFIQLLKNTEDNNRKKIIKLEENNKQIIIENNKIKENLNEVKKNYNNKFIQLLKNTEDNLKNKIIILEENIQKFIGDILINENNEFIQLLKNTEDNLKKKIVILEENYDKIKIENIQIKDVIMEKENTKEKFNNKIIVRFIIIFLMLLSYIIYMKILRVMNNLFLEKNKNTYLALEEINYY
jgi:hypothetical protein